MPPVEPEFTRRRLLTSLAPAAGLTAIGVSEASAREPQIAGTRTKNPAGAKWKKGKRFAGDPGVGRVYYGSVIPTTTSVESFEARIRHPLGSRRNFHQATQTRALIERARADVAAKRFSILSTKPPGSWRSVAQGEHNAWLDEIFDGLGAINAPMAFTIHHEPENDVDGNENTPDWHKRMTEYALNRASRRAPKVHVIQILMQFTFESRVRKPKQWLAPSVDLFGLDAYNFWSPGGSLEWVSFKSMVSRAQEWSDGKPVVIGEYGVRTDPSRPGRAARWMEKAYEYASKNDVVAMNYFNVDPGDIPSFTLDAERLAAFTKCLRDDRSVRLKHKRR